MDDDEANSKLVFVDPEDETLPYWWPAIIVTEAELDTFRETMDSDISRIKPNERLVCYFEDASFSVVPASAIIPFCPEKEPFVSYAKNIRRFTSDLGVSRALAFWNDGIIPSGFKWLLPQISSHPATDEIVALVELSQSEPKLTIAKKTKKGQPGRKKNTSPKKSPPLPRTQIKKANKKDKDPSPISSSKQGGRKPDVKKADYANDQLRFLPPMQPKFKLLGHLLPTPY